MRIRVLPAALFVVSLAIGGGLTLLIHRIEHRAETERFARIADVTVSRLQARLEQHIALLVATAGAVEGLDLEGPDVKFASYVRRLDLHQNYPGIQGVGFSRIISSERDSRFYLDRTSRLYGRPVVLRPAQSNQTTRTAITMLEPRDERNMSALGFDMFSNDVRRQAMTRAAMTGEPAMSGPVELVQEITDDKQKGFLIYVPVLRPGAVPNASDPMAALQGFVYAPFRAGDLHQTVQNERGVTPLHIVTLDRDMPLPVLYDGGPPSLAGGLVVQRNIDVAGRSWQITLSQASVAATPAHIASSLVGVLSVLLSAALAALLRGHNMALIEAEKRAHFARRLAEDRNLLLREMAHRIKNHLARIQAISRQTQREVTDLAGFSQRFGARLQAMAAAQDLLSAEGAAHLRPLALRELGQIMPQAQAEAALDGPWVELDPRQAQAMALVLHELATNAMKYGTPEALGQLSVHWRIEPRAGGDWLQTEWFEPGVTAPAIAEGQSHGFGTVLLEAMVEGDLEGRLTRGFSAQGMTVQIGFPLRRSGY